MTATATPTARAGVQVPLVHALLDFGAAIEGCGSPQWHAPLLTALIFGMRDAAQALVDTLARAVETLGTKVVQKLSEGG